MDDLILRKHYDQKYHTLFNKKTGFFARIEEKGIEEPFWAQDGPELLDISITNYCQKGCTFCYRQSNETGKHMSAVDYKYIIEQARDLGVLQIALGGGNPNQHPEFVSFLKIAKENGIVPSYTTNGDGLTDEIFRVTKENCGAIAISAYKPFSKLSRIVERVLQFGIKTNIHFVVSSESIFTVIEWLKSPPKFLDKINALVFLNYKPVNTSSQLNLSGSDQLSLFFDLLKNNRYKFKIGFDSCFMSGIVSNLNIKSVYLDSCDSARFSAFISEDLKMYPCSFMINSGESGDLKKDSLISIWKNNVLFVNHRNKIRNIDCNSCSFKNDCKGGCVFIPNVNLCNK